MPEPPAPVPVPDVPAPDEGALPVPAIFAAGTGDWTGIRGCGATTGVASAFLAGAPAGRFILLGFAAGGGGGGGGGGGKLMSMVFSCSTTRSTVCPLSPLRISAASAAWTAATAAIALARSGRSAVPV